MYVHNGIMSEHIICLGSLRYDCECVVAPTKARTGSGYLPPGAERVASQQQESGGINKIR